VELESGWVQAKVSPAQFRELVSPKSAASETGMYELYLANTGCCYSLPVACFC